jgi:predicted HD phosphohydrolase/alpha-ketoglutarate-dependent taurine dioxygenase
LFQMSPREPGECTRFGSNVSTLRETEWGETFQVRSTPDDKNKRVKKDLAYTSHRIGMHVDSPYRVDSPPAYQLLHALEHCSGEGCQVHNKFVDGWAVAKELCETQRDLFDSLTQVNLRWENNGGDDGSLLFRYAPMLELQEAHGVRNHVQSKKCPAVKAINFSAKSGGYAPNLPREELEVFFKAKRMFSDFLHDERFTVQVQLYPGALVIFDNRRVLHSRSAIAETDGARWLQGCYLNRDGVLYDYERLRRKWISSKRLTETPFRNLRQATRADFDRMGREYDREVSDKTLDHLIKLLQDQKEYYLGAPVSLFEHNVQTATRALRNGQDDETITVSLFHDVFETLAVKNHGELASAMLAPWISPRSQWLLAHHEIFQGFYYFGYYGLDDNKRDMFIGHPYYNWTVEWCEKYDQAAFDPDYPTLPLTQLLPAVKRVLSRPQYWWNPSHPKAGAVSAAQEMDGEKSLHSSIDGVAATPTNACVDTWTCFNSTS